MAWVPIISLMAKRLPDPADPTRVNNGYDPKQKIRSEQGPLLRISRSRKTNIDSPVSDPDDRKSNDSWASHVISYQTGFSDTWWAFKSVAKTDHLQQIFQPEWVDSNQWVARKSVSGLSGLLNEKWWGMKSRTQCGGHFDVPAPAGNGSSGWNKGVAEDNNGPFTVYVFWLEL